MPDREHNTLRLILEDDGRTGAERLAIWRDMMRLSCRVHVDDEDRFSGAFVSRNFGEVRTMRLRSSTFRAERDREMTRRIGRDHVILNFVEEGRFSGRLGNRRVNVERGELLFLRLTSPLDIMVEDASWSGLFLPTELFDRHVVRTSELDGRVFGAGTAAAVLLGGFMSLLHRLPDPLPGHELDRVIASAYALLASSFANASPSEKSSLPSDEDLGRAVRRFIRERLSDPDLGSELICRELSLSRSRLYRVMGVDSDVSAIVRRMRLQSAHQEIAEGRSGNVPLTIVGRSWGYADDRSFRRAFSREFGYSPSALRKRRDMEAVGDVIPGSVGIDLERWFLDT